MSGKKRRGRSHLPHEAARLVLAYVDVQQRVPPEEPGEDEESDRDDGHNGADDAERVRDEDHAEQDSDLRGAVCVNDDGLDAEGVQVGDHVEQDSNVLGVGRRVEAKDTKAAGRDVWQRRHRGQCEGGSKPDVCWPVTFPHRVLDK
eukprot:354643-Chlamydomonas_euryale.AAC.1